MRSDFRHSIVLVGALIALALSSAGCSSVSSCSRDEDHIDVDGWVSPDRTTFSSVKPAPPAADGGVLSGPELEMLEPYTYFPANRIVTFHVGLIDVPTDINIYLTFSRDRDATIAPCAGNQCLIRRFNKDEIVLRNDTCTEFWVLLTASTSPMPFQPVTDGGVDEGTSGAAGAAGAAE